MFVRPRIHTAALIHIVLTAQALVLLTTPSPAIQLFWSGGSADLLVPQDTRAVLLVQADPAEVTLPGSWRLLWTADSSGLEIVSVDSSPACLSDTAKAVSVDPPASAADSAANQVTAHFCSAGMNSASTAYCFVDLVGGSKGKLKVVALDPADPDLAAVIESNEVRFNGGMEGEYEPVVLHTSSVHQSLQLRVTAVGSGLNTASSMSIGAPDASWSLPLTVTSRSHASVTGVAWVAALLPECQTTVGSATGAFSGATLAADEEPASESPQSCQAQYFEELLQPPPPLHGYTIQPKDFAFARGFADESSNRYALHFFYIRHNYWYYPPAPATQHPELDEKNIGHTWTTDFNSWYGPDGLNNPDTLALRVRPGKFDEFHVWAPTIIKPEGSPVF